MKIEIPTKDRQELDARHDRKWKQAHGHRGSYYKTFAEPMPGMVHGPIAGTEERPPRPLALDVYGIAPLAIAPPSPVNNESYWLNYVSLAYVKAIADSRQPRYDWQKTVVFARMNGVRL